MRIPTYLGLCLLGWTIAGLRAEPLPAPQRFLQEVARQFGVESGLTATNLQLLDLVDGTAPRAFGQGRWFECRDVRWQPVAGLECASEREFVLAGESDVPVRLPMPWPTVRQVVRRGPRVWVVTETNLVTLREGKVQSLDWPGQHPVRQLAVSATGGLFVASSRGLFHQTPAGWMPLTTADGLGRAWGVGDVLGVAFDRSNRLWFATPAGVVRQADQGWRFYEGKDGLPWRDFTGLASGPKGEMWFGTRLGTIRFEAGEWHYRQGPRWLPHDWVRDLTVDAAGNAWVATPGGVGRLERIPLTLAQKAAIYEEEIQRYIKRTSWGYVAEAPLHRVGDKSSFVPTDSDNDGLWTAMYGAGECFAYAATRDPVARERAQKAFEALRFLQTVTQGGPHSPPPGYVARTIRPVAWPDPNEGRLKHDQEQQSQDSLWKVYEPRWPRSADGQWYWKSDTSSDELDGHYFLYALYYDLVAQTDAEKEPVRQVVRALTDHLLTHRFMLIDHDGKPTRWAVYAPERLNRDPHWWPERGLNSLSVLSYLAVAAYVTGDPKYSAASRELIDLHGYAQNAMYPKVQLGPGSGNQSDDEMAFMCYLTLLQYSKDEALKAQLRYSFFQYWAGEAPEMNPFFNFAYARISQGASSVNPFGRFSLKPWNGWFEDAMATLRGFPLDRLNWPSRNSHRLDIRPLGPQQSTDLYEPQRGGRGHRVNGKVLPVENRHFNHWNTDPWQLDYEGRGDELAAGTVFLLPYYMGLYCGFIEKP